MAKLYAELTSDKGGRIASKGGDETMTIKLVNGNIEVATIQFWCDKDFTKWQNTIKIVEHVYAIDTVVEKKLT